MNSLLKRTHASQFYFDLFMTILVYVFFNRFYKLLVGFEGPFMIHYAEEMI